MVDVDMVHREDTRLPSGARVYEGQRQAVSLDIGHYLWVLRRQWVVIALCMVLGAVAAFAYVTMSPKVAIARTTVQLNVIMTEPFSSQRPASGLLDASTEANIARSHVVAERAAATLGDGVSATDVRSVSEITLSAGATVVEITFEAATADEAIAGANAVAQAYLSFRSNQAESRVDTIVQSLTQQIDDLNGTLNDFNETITSTSESSAQHIQALTGQQQVLAELEGLLNERNALRSVDTTGGVVLSGAEHNMVDYEPSLFRTLALGLGAGLVIGLLIAFARHPFDHRVKRASDASRMLAAPLLTKAPKLSVASQSVRSPREQQYVSSLQVATERILTDLTPDSTLVVLDAATTDGPSSAFEHVTHTLIESDLGVRMLTPDVREPAEIIAALRDADAVVLIWGKSIVDSLFLRWLRNEADVSGTKVLGIIEHASNAH